MSKWIDTDAQIRAIITSYKKYSHGGEEVIQNAYKYAQKAHLGRVRKSGDPYITHPVSAASELMVIEPDLTTLVATLLHDTVSDGSGTLSEIEKLFWPEVSRIIAALDKIGHIKYRGNTSTVERLQRTFIAMAEDVRSIFVKFAERIHNLRTLQYHENPETANRIADESLSIYAPIAARLGLYTFKETMETLALRQLDLDGYLLVTGELAHYTLAQDQFLTQSVQWVREILPAQYRESVSYRIKKPYSLYRKLKQSGLKSIREIYDVFALRIIVDDIADCYSVLGIIHGGFTPLPGRFKDFIAVPKANGYQSLHTTVLGFQGYKQPIEIQIRTRQMDEDAERGTASHVLYKMQGDGISTKNTYQDLVQATMDTLLSQKSLLGQKILFPTIFVFSPKGDVFELPHKSTPVDFAYAVHSDVWYHTVGARVNGRITTLDAFLHNGDVVEIITSPQAHPVEQWMDFVVSSKAKSQIGVEIKRLSWDRVRIVERGKHLLFDTFKRADIPLKDDLSNFSQYYGSVLDDKKQEELYYHLGLGIRRASSFLPRRKTPTKVTHTVVATPIHIIIGGEKQIPHQVAQCCHPEYPMDIIAVLRTGGKCMIHAKHCSGLTRVNPDRLLSAYWQVGWKGKIISCSLLFHEGADLVGRVTKILYDMGVNIIDLNVISQEDHTIRIRASLEISEDDGSFLDRFSHRLRLTLPEFLTSEDDFFDKKK